MTHPIKKTAAVENEENPSPPQWPSYSGTSEYVGTSPSGRVSVYVDPTLGQPALQNAQDLLQDADRVVAANDAIFGTTGGPVSVIIFALGGETDGTGGADHSACDYTTGAGIEVCASFGKPERVSALFEAELSECSMGGNLCGLSTGEGLSRWCAAVIGNNAPADLPLGSIDPDNLLWAERNGCVVVSFDKGTMPGHLARHLQGGHHSPGVYIVRGNATIPQIVDYLVLSAYTTDPALLQDHYECVP